MSRRPRQFYRILFFAIGCGLFFALLLRLGPARIFSLLLQIGWHFAFIVMAYAGHQIARAAALRRCIVADHDASFGDLVKIRLAGEAVRVLTFTGPFLAEPAKALLLRKAGLNTSQAFAATTSEYLVYTFTSAVMAVWGLSYLLYAFELSPAAAAAARIVIYAAAAFAITCIAATVGRIYLIGAVVKRIHRLPWIGSRLARVDETKLRDTEDLLFAILRTRPWRLLSILAIESGAQALLVFELFVILRSTGQAFSGADPILIESASKFVGLAFFFIPGQIGAAEGTYAVIFEATGLPAFAGFSLALARRLRTVLIGGAGLVYVRPQTSADRKDAYS